jgi:hypothetical protein
MAKLSRARKALSEVEELREELRKARAQVKRLKAELTAMRPAPTNTEQ